MTAASGAERQAKCTAGKKADGKYLLRVWILAETEEDCKAAVAVVQAKAVKVVKSDA